MFKIEGDYFRGVVGRGLRYDGLKTEINEFKSYISMSFCSFCFFSISCLWSSLL